MTMFEKLRLPWKHDAGFHDDILDCDGNTIAECDAPDSAQFIVLAANCHADLLAACEAVLPWVVQNAKDDLATLVAAISKAKVGATK